MGITRRDFLNGFLLAAGGSWVGAMSPLRVLRNLVGTASAGSVDVDLRALGGGNIPSAFMAAHWLRDERLTFSRTSVTVAPGGVDSTAGTFPIISETGSYDAIVVGGGLSGLSSAFHISLAKPNAKILILDEPTASLTDREVDSLFGVVKQIRLCGPSIRLDSNR